MNTPARILLVDDDPIVIESLGVALRHLGQIRFAMDGPQALQAIRDHAPDLLLLDVGLPGMSGFEVLQALRAERGGLSDLPVIFLTSHVDPSEELLGLNLGAVDFIFKPPRAPLVQARVRTHLRLKQLSDALRERADTDGLTGIANRRHFDEVFHREWMRAQRDGTPLSLLLIDIDHFKAYNDHHGHPEGDRCLLAVTRALRSALRRPADLLARYGGEEFVVLLPQTGEAGAVDVGGMLLQAVDELLLPHGGGAGHPWVSISVGVATRQSHASAQALLDAADRALYQAKRLGRHQVRSA